MEPKMDVHEVFQHKAEELQRWLTEQNLYKPGKIVRATFVMLVNEEPTVTVDVRTITARHGTPIKRLSAKKWNEILSPEVWEEEERDFLKALRTNNNVPTNADDFFFSARGVARSRMNEKLRRLKLPYRLDAPGQLPNYNGGRGPLVLVKVK